MKLTFPFPPKELSPNARLHWAKRAKAVKAYRNECMIIARNAGAKVDWEGQVHLFDIWFHPPTHRRYDRDNLIASMKAGMDGLADALGVDDVRFAPRYFMGEKKTGGAVVIVLPEIIP